MDFVSTLPKPLSARSRDFLAVWHGWRGSRLLPERRDMRLADLGELAGTSLLLNVRGHDDILIEWVGDSITKQIGVDLGGCNYLDLTTKENRAWRAHLTMAQVAQPCSAVIYYWLRLGRGGILPVEFISGPLLEDGATQSTLVLCCASSLTRAGSDKAVDPDSYEEGEGMRFIDIGAGVPSMVPSQRQEARPVQ
jgi:hypothetical protein